MEEYVVYILYSPSAGKSYVGYTSHLIERIKSHNYYGADWTKNYKPWWSMLNFLKVNPKR